MTHHLIIGNGVAGTTAAENIRKHAGKDPITILSSEHIPFYYRIRLNDLIAGTIDEKSIIARKDSWYREKDLTLELSTRVTGVDVKSSTVHTDSKVFHYDRLLIATGSHPFVPPIPGTQLPAVHTLHTFADALAIKGKGGKAKNIVIIGGGLLGLETAASMRTFGVAITVVEFLPRLLPRQLDASGGKRLEEMLGGLLGVTFKIGTGVAEIRKNTVLLDSGESLPADLVIISAGVRPDLSLARALHLDCDRGIIVDNHMQTSSPNIYAAGDVAQFEKTVYGIWPAAQEQGRCAGENMAGVTATYAGTTMANILKVAGVALASAGEIDVDGQHEVLVDEDRQVYRKLVFRGNHLIGCILLGDTAGYPAALRAITQKEEIASPEIFRDKLRADRGK